MPVYKKPIAVMKQHGFHAPVDTTHNEHPDVTRARLLGVDIAAVTGYSGPDKIGGGRLAAVRSEIAAIEIARSTPWQDIDIKDSNRIRIRAVQAERKVAQLQLEVLNLQGKLKALASEQPGSVLDVMTTEREFLLQGAMEAADTEKELRRQLAEAESKLEQANRQMQESTAYKEEVEDQLIAAEDSARRAEWRADAAEKRVEALELLVKQAEALAVVNSDHHDANLQSQLNAALTDKSELRLKVLDLSNKYATAVQQRTEAEDELDRVKHQFNDLRQDVLSVRADFEASKGISPEVLEMQLAIARENIRLRTIIENMAQGAK